MQERREMIKMCGRKHNQNISFVIILDLDWFRIA